MDSRPKQRWAIWFSLPCLAVLAWLSIPFFNGAHRQATCQENLNQIAQGLHAYHEVHGEFPPPFIMNELGEPLHSWRVLILPYVGCQDLYDDLDLTRQWNHPDNIKHQGRLPDVFRCPTFVPTKKMREFMTSYVAVVGANSMWQSCDYGIKLSDVEKSHDQTVLLIESDKFGVHWMAPFDVSETRIFESTAEASNPFFGEHNGDSHILMVDGTLKTATSDLDMSEFRKMLSISTQ